MPFKLLTVELVVIIHDAVLNEGELTGLAKDKSLDGALSRVLHRVHYGLISDVYDLAANYAMAIATGHCLNDANKRTAFSVMVHVLSLHDVKHNFDKEAVAKKIIEVAKGQVDEVELAEWLRENTRQN